MGANKYLYTNSTNTEVYFVSGTASVGSGTFTLGNLPVGSRSKSFDWKVWG